MFAKFSALLALFTAVAVAQNSCNVGDLQCCQSVQKANEKTTSGLLDFVGAVVPSADVMVGITCTPISVIGVNGNSCNAQTVCCEDNNHNGIVAIGCTPINLDA